MTAMLGVIVIYVYSAVAFVFVSDTWYDPNINTGLLDRVGDSVCMSMLHCFLSALNYGIRGGGGVGDFLPHQSSAAWNRQGKFFREIFDASFFMIVITILLNIIFGVIIDSFAQLRGLKSERDDDIKNVCFICDIER
jgi:hypothetical protein